MHCSGESLTLQHFRTICLPSPTAIHVTVCCLAWQSCWAGSQEDDWSKSHRGCTLSRLSHFITLISCCTLTKHLIHARWYSTSCFTFTVRQRITHRGYFCSTGPIMEHDLILLDTKPIQGDCFTGSSSLPSQCGWQSGGGGGGGVLGVERPWLRGK